MLKIWGRKTSVNVQKVMFAVGELGLAHHRFDYGGHFGGLETPEYGMLNPNRLVPTIDDNGFVLWESAAILRYLAAKRPERGLVPSGLMKQAQVDQWMFWWTAHLEPALDRLVYERRVKPFLGRPGIFLEDPIRR